MFHRFLARVAPLLVVVAAPHLAGCGATVHVVTQADRPGQDLGLPPPSDFATCNSATTYEHVDTDHNGHADAVRVMNGEIEVCRGTDTNQDGKIDTWDQYKDGKLEKRAHDSDGNGKVDQVMHWSNPLRPECAILAADKDGDGKADVGPTVDLCAALGPETQPLLPLAKDPGAPSSKP